VIILLSLGAMCWLPEVGARGCGGGVSTVAGSFVCRGCLGPVAGAGRAGVDVGASVGLELVDGFCCLGGVLSVDARGWGC